MSERPYSQGQFYRAGEVMDAAALSGFDQRTQEVFAETLATAYRAGRLAQAEEDARIALAQKGKAADIRHNRGPKLSGYYAEDQAEILAEERGEDIAAEIIAAAIRANAAKIGEGGE